VLASEGSLQTWKEMCNMSLAKSSLGLLVTLALTLSAGFIGSRFPVDDWYAALSKPAWTPPNSLFGPVWGVLYLIIAVAAWLVWRKAGLAGAVIPLGVFALQLVLNAAWSWLFFGLHQLAIGLLEIALLWISIVVTLVLFWRLSPTSGLLMIPYLFWVSFATALNFSIWRLNA
jgi:tryptophan-rich sensory protein